MSGFLEFGLPALIAFVFINVAGGWTFINDLPPVNGSNSWKELEEGIPMKGAKLMTPKITEKTPVG